MAGDSGMIGAVVRGLARVTVAMNSVEFHEPVFVGDIVSFYTKVVHIGRTSITIHVTVETDRHTSVAGIDIEWGHDATQIAIEDHVMALPSREASEELNERYDRSPDDDLTVLDIEYLVDRQIWSVGTSVGAAANELGLSVATLKRRLRERGKTYSAVVSDRRHYWARELLATTMPIRDIARTLGYPYSGNFTRAFARMAGITPADFRRRNGGDSIEK